MQIKFILILLMSALLTACMIEPLKAPCDSRANFCGTKTKINQW